MVRPSSPVANPKPNNKPSQVSRKEYRRKVAPDSIPLTDARFDLFLYLRQQVACLLAFKQTVQITTQVDSKYISKVKNPTHRGEAMHAQSG